MGETHSDSWMSLEDARMADQVLDWPFIAYVFLSIVITLTLLVQINNTGRTWAALTTTLLVVLIFIFFGLRWFRGTTSKLFYSGPWPPIINTCPDYLVLVNRSDGTQACADFIGVNRSSGALKNWTTDDNVQNPPADPAKYFTQLYRPGMNAQQIKNLCTAAMEKKLTWEGITNGDSCTFNTKNSRALSGEGSGNCPTAAATV